MEGIETEISPTESELREARQRLETTVKSLESSVEIEEANFFLGWQDSEEKISYRLEDNKIYFFLNSSENWGEEVHENVLRALLGLEYLDKKDFDRREFIWQDIALQSYTKSRELMITDYEPSVSDLERKWTEIKELILDEDDEALYSHVPVLTSALGSEKSPSELLEMKRSDILESLEELFG